VHLEAEAPDRLERRRLVGLARGHDHLADGDGLYVARSQRVEEPRRRGLREETKLARLRRVEDGAVLCHDPVEQIEA
jgi:hypothetical protein